MLVKVNTGVYPWSLIADEPQRPQRADEQSVTTRVGT
jgi:hypothetical protein